MKGERAQKIHTHGKIRKFLSAGKNKNKMQKEKRKSEMANERNGFCKNITYESFEDL